MHINRHNYEAFLLDMLEGSLSVEEEQLLQDFLVMNPDCAPELSQIEPWALKGGKVSYRNVNLLKKELPGAETKLTPRNFDLFSIARMEGDLSEVQCAAHQAMVEGDRVHARLWEEWRQTRMVPEELLFKGKAKLKRKEGRRGRMLWISALSSAAALGLVLILVRQGSEVPPRELTRHAPAETTIQQEESLPGRGLIEVNPAGQPEEQDIEQTERVKTALEKPAPNSTGGAMFSVKKAQDRPLEPTFIRTAQRDDLQPRPIKIAGNSMKSSTFIALPEPDRIEPLYLSPASIHLSSLSLAQISELDFQLMLEEYREEKDISFWTLANAGIQGINKLAGSDISLMASRDDEGEVSGFQLKSKRFSFSRPLGGEE